MPMGIGPGLSVTRFESGIPGWMTGMDLGWDFTQNVQYSGATNPTDTHSATVYAQSAAGVWSPFAANTLVRTDLGLQTVPTRTNLVANTDLSNAYWTLGANLTRGASSTVGGLPMWTFTSSAASLSFNRRNIAVSSSTQYTYAYWSAAQITAGSNVVVAQPSNTNYTLTGIQIGSLWYYSVTFTVGASDTSLNVFTGPVDAPAAATFTVGAPILVQAAFAGPPILTTGSSATVNGNLQVADLTGRLSAGVGGILQVNVLETGSVVSRLLEINDGASSTNAVVAYLAASSNQIVFQTVVGGANTMLIYPEANAGATGVMTIAFAASSNYLMVQVIGKTTPAAITSGSYPSGMSKFGFFGRGYDSQRNAYALTRRAALRFGAQNASTFADLFAKATILAAVS